jgi:hypothetical protein
MLEALGMVGGGLLGQVGDALAMPRKLLWSGANALYNAATGSSGEAPESGTELLGRLGMDPDSPWTKALGFGVEALTDPLTYAGGLLGRAGGAAAKGLGGASEGGGAFSAMRNLRGGVGVVKNVKAVTPEIADEVASVAARGGAKGLTISPDNRFIGRQAVASANPAANSRRVGELGRYFEASPATEGGFLENARTMYFPDTLPPEFLPEALRHEGTHAMRDSLVRMYKQGLPAPQGTPLPLRATARMYASDNRLAHALGQIADEATAYGMSQKGALNKILGTTDFLLDTNPAYISQFQENGSPLAATIYRSLPYLAAGAGGAGTAVPAYLYARD